MEKSEKNIIAIVIATFFAFALIGFLVQAFILKPSFNKIMIRAANEINKNAPIMVDKETRMDNVVAFPGNFFQYNYRLINYDRAAIDTTLFKQSIEPNILNNIKTNPQMKLFREHRATLAYNYVDKNGVFIVRMVFTPDRYN